MALPTGSGKTLISALLVAHYADSIVAAAQRDGPRTRVLFLCPTKTLAQQQTGALQAAVPLRVRCLTGDDGIDVWSAAQWAALLAEAEVLVATPQCIVEALSKTFIKARAPGAGVSRSRPYSWAARPDASCTPGAAARRAAARA